MLLFIFSFFTTFFLSVFIIITKKWHLDITSDSTHGVQKFHKKPIPRIGGIPIFLSLILSTYFLILMVKLLFDCSNGCYSILIGIIEDLTTSVSVSIRLTATLVSGAIFIFADYSITSVDIVFFDNILEYRLISLALLLLLLLAS